MKTLFGIGSVVVLVVLAVIGWVLNILALASAGAVDGEVILRAIGIFVFPIGVVMGWFF